MTGVLFRGEKGRAGEDGGRWWSPSDPDIPSVCGDAGSRMERLEAQTRLGEAAGWCGVRPPRRTRKAPAGGAAANFRPPDGAGGSAVQGSAGLRA